MSLTSIIFSKDRPAQLDLLLRSMKANAPGLIRTPPTVIAKVADDYSKGYAILEEEHRKVWYWREQHGKSFKDVLSHRLDMLAEGDHVAFFVDDDVIYRSLPVANPAAFLDLFPATLCFSLRLGLQTEYCYSLRSPQELAEYQRVGAFVHWDWRDDGTLDYSYPSSLDGHIFRRDDLLTMLDGADFSNPNQLEERLVEGCRRFADTAPRMAAFSLSCLVGCPANSVSTTHGSNRHGETYPAAPADLNALYLSGKRLALESIDSVLVDAAHREFELRWET